ncbi:MAG: hypothetical protein D6685_02840 [Bacteroidetes bacterium]|nr:MAG: hypothetical protein D6685_02840 [Bacteroidota bacterium]
MRYLAALFLAVVLLAPAGRAGAAPPPEPPAEIRFSEQILPILQQELAPVLDRLPGLTYDSWDGLVAGADFGQVLVPFDAEHSLLVQLADHTDGVSEASRAQLRQWIDEGARSDDGTVPYADVADRPLLYVANQGAAMVSVIDMARNVVVRNVKLQALGFDANAKPHHTAVEPDGSHWYVSLIGASQVLKFDRDNRLVGQVAFETPGMLALHPTEDLLYVARSMMAVNPPTRIGAIRRSDLALTEIDVFFPRPHALALNPAAGYVYTASLAENRIASVPVGEEDVAELIGLDGPVHTLVQFAVSPDGQTMVAGGQLTGAFFLFDLSDPATPTPVARLDLGAMPWHPVFTPDGRFVYIGNQGANTVTVVDVARREVAAVITGDGLAEPHGIAVSPDGRFVYVSNRNLKSAYTPRWVRFTQEMAEEGPAHEGTDHAGMGHDGHGMANPPEPTANHDMDHGMMMDMEAEYGGTVVVIDTATQEIVRVLELGAYPSGMSTRPF